MPTLNRLLLVFVSLLFGPLAAMADELPEDTNQIETLSAEQAQRLADTFPGVKVSTNISGHEHTLPGRFTYSLYSYPSGTGRIHSFTFHDGLPLNGLTTLDADVARALARYGKGPLFLDGLTALDADTADAFAAFGGESLSLRRLQRASFGEVAALRKNPRISMPNHWYLLRE